jgi:ABC-type nitrate/sulfonate/bicarbonate transport system permease component
MSDSITSIAKGTYAKNLKKSANNSLIGFAAGAVLGMIGGHFLGLGAWKPALLGGGIGFLASKLNRNDS